MNEIVKIKEGFILREVAGSFIVVAVGEMTKNFNAIINLNGTGAFLWNKLINGASREQLADALLEEYEVDRETALKDIDTFLTKIQEAGLTE